MKIDGLPVRDAKTRLPFQVTNQDIKLAGLKKPESCAIALACKRLKNYGDVRIHMHYAYILKGDHWLRYRIPQSVIREIVAFDRGGSFEPGEYALLPPAPSCKLGRINVGQRRSVRTGPKKSRFYHATTNVRTRPEYA
jgi:hypothetical protein